MSLKLYFHPLASFCHKVLIAFHENELSFEPVIVDFGDPASVAAFKAVWPMAKMPVLRDEARGCTAAESTILVEYLDAHYPGKTRFLPSDADGAWRTRMWDRFFDYYVHHPMQTDRHRPAAAERQPGCLRRGAGASQPARSLCVRRRRAWLPALDDGRGFRPGRLLGGAGAVLRQHRRAVRRRAGCGSKPISAG